MYKRYFSILLIISLIIIAAFPVSAAETRDSSYFTNCNAYLLAGSGSGELDLVYRASTTAPNITKLGISQIKVYRTNGIIYKTIYGTASNGLIETSGSLAGGTYTISCEANVSYYCVVTFISQNAAGSDTRTITTGTVRATPQLNK